MVTFEFENVPAATAEAAAEFAAGAPGGQVLYTTQHRLREKTFLHQAGFPVVPFAPVRSLEELARALGELGCPAVLKTAGWGYDGKGQSKITAPADAAAAWATLGDRAKPCSKRSSISSARCRSWPRAGVDGADGRFWRAWPTRIANHILDVTVAPAAVPAAIAREAVEICPRRCSRRSTWWASCASSSS